MRNWRDTRAGRAWLAYRLRWKRRDLIRRGIWSQRRLTPVADRTAQIARGDILAFVCLRNEAPRLNEFLAHYRGLGVGHFLIVDNASTDGTAEFLTAQPDVSLWHTGDSYRASRFGMDWMNGLLFRHGRGHWCLTVDADELLIYDDCKAISLKKLSEQLESLGKTAMGALMLDLYPRGPLGTADAPESAPSTARLPWFDAGPYRCRVNPRDRTRRVQGGARERVFFRDNPDLSPTLNKIPFVKWRIGHAYVNSTHTLYPPRLNDEYSFSKADIWSGVLLHTKFLPSVLFAATEDINRRQHFARPDDYRPYYQGVLARPHMWSAGAVRYNGADDLLHCGLMVAPRRAEAV
ncbi:glycosyltransferase family 2 protein [Paracoccus sp. (in: a-proteobacteria)]|uniref:glycosyltransferase family 2 protein n=1 Tax=Paracoccus sp. TaxID=267 RepID=UPI0026DECC92|nr:glycosyltransferase family 2 protein [Paracoccus sp. (in: a-proteobacteria)]MDO5648880.1 glycosyltransferase family 2 protein [Paracoccus sp. (in: a-proteobacteria)]